MNESYRNPFPTVDIIIEINSDSGITRKEKKVVLITRKNPPRGWALPGGFVDYGESLEQAAIREAREETSLDISIIKQFHTYSEPDRDPRHHTISTVFIAGAKGTPAGMDDAGTAEIFGINDLPGDIVFDHRTILNDYFNEKY